MAVAHLQQLVMLKTLLLGDMRYSKDIELGARSGALAVWWWHQLSSHDFIPHRVKSQVK